MLGVTQAELLDSRSCDDGDAYACERHGQAKLASGQAGEATKLIAKALEIRRQNCELGCHISCEDIVDMSIEQLPGVSLSVEQVAHFRELARKLDVSETQM